MGHGVRGGINRRGVMGRSIGTGPQRKLGARGTFGTPLTEVAASVSPSGLVLRATCPTVSVSLW